MNVKQYESTQYKSVGMNEWKNKWHWTEHKEQWKSAVIETQSTTRVPAICKSQRYNVNSQN